MDSPSDGFERKISICWMQGERPDIIDIILFTTASNPYLLRSYHLRMSTKISKFGIRAAQHKNQEVNSPEQQKESRIAEFEKDHAGHSKLEIEVGEKEKNKQHCMTTDGEGMEQHRWITAGKKGGCATRYNDRKQAYATKGARITETNLP